MIARSERRGHRWFGIALVGMVWLGLGVVGCGPAEVETIYGRSRGQSINGTNAFADLLRAQGHTVRAAIRYNEVLADWAAVVVRFAPYPGPPSHDEAEWLSDWLGGGPGRKVVYIARDYDAGPEFWAKMVAALPASTPAADRARVEARRDQSRKWVSSLPSRSKNPAGADIWFGIAPGDPKQPDTVAICRELDGSWAEGIDPVAAALPRHEAIQAEYDEQILLSGDERKLAVSWTFRADEDEAGQGNVLVLANGSFLLNAALLNQARRPLAARVAAWIGADAAHVGFVEGTNVLAESDPTATSPWHLLTVEPFNWVVAHLAAFGALLCLSLAATIGRPRPEPAGEIERPSAHPIALGSILARTRQAATAQELLAHYRRWRHPSGSSPRTDPAPTLPRRAPLA